MQTFSERLKELRMKKNLSIREVATTLKVSHSTYRAWEMGVQIRGEPYEKLAEILNVSLNELMTGKPTAIETHLYTIEYAAKSIRSMLMIIVTILLASSSAFASRTTKQCKMAYLQHHERTKLLNDLLTRGEISPISFESREKDNESIFQLSISLMCKKIRKKSEKTI